MGWEIFVPTQFSVQVFKLIEHAGAEFDLCNVGLHAVNSLRLEKGFRHWGHDIGEQDNLLQAGLGFAAKPNASNFLGREAFLQLKSSGLPTRRLVQFKLTDPEPLLYHNEPIVMDNKIVGHLTSGMYGHAVGGALGMGYVDVPELTVEKLSQARFEIEVAKVRFEAQASLKAFYDPSNSRMRT